MVTVPLYIDGSELGGVGTVSRENPARPSEQVAEIAVGDAATCMRAVTAAQQAFSSWAAVDVATRVQQVAEAVDAASAGNVARSRILARELGKVAPDALGEMNFARALATYYGPVVRRQAADTVVEDAEGRLVTLHEPYGVIGAITPWNAPVILASLKVVPALMTGNTMVIKPSPLAPVAVTEFLTLVGSALPAGVLNIINGGADVGGVIVGDPRIAKISFTGGPTTARAIATTAAARITPTVMELGGNDAAVFLDDAPFDDAMFERAVFGAFLTSGQVCMAIKRIFVPEARAAEFVDGFTAAAERVLHTADPLAEGTTMGPVVTREHQRRLIGLVESGREAGGHVIELGTFEPPDPDGYWVRPTLVTGLADLHPLVADEQFGPTVPLLTYRDEDEAVRRANSVDQALASSVWTADDERAWAFARRFRAGATFVNCHNRAGTSLRASFGGRGASGHGREFGELGVAEYLQSHSINYPNAIRFGEARGNAYPVPS